MDSQHTTLFVKKSNISNLLEKKLRSLSIICKDDHPKLKSTTLLILVINRHSISTL